MSCSHSSRDARPNLNFSDWRARVTAVGQGCRPSIQYTAGFSSFTCARRAAQAGQTSQSARQSSTLAIVFLFSTVKTSNPPEDISNNGGIQQGDVSMVSRCALSVELHGYGIHHRLQRRQHGHERIADW